MNQFGERRDKKIIHGIGVLIVVLRAGCCLAFVDIFLNLVRFAFQCSISSSNASLLVCNGGAFWLVFTGSILRRLTILYSTLETANHVGRPRLAILTLCSLRIIYLAFPESSISPPVAANVWAVRGAEGGETTKGFSYISIA